MNASRLRVREAVPSDEDAIRACVGDAYQSYRDRMDKPPAPLLDDYADLISRHVVHVAVVEGSVVGLIVMWPEADHLFIDNIAVAPHTQGAGVGSRLLQVAEDHARRSGLRSMRLYTNERMTENLSYYSRRGFVETHRQIDAGYRRVYFERAVPSNE